jgi:hypothetical protein
VGNTPVSLAEDLTATILSIMAIVIPVLIAIICAIVFVLAARWVSRRRQVQRPA